ncbi:hypothetical protein AXA44_34480 [Rhodococcus sp. SC4]|nr:hypothetical protein AXA44_34480 [Rhodococcus sp. SC4]
MAEVDPLSTQRDRPAGLTAELNAVGFEDPHQIGRGGFGVVYRCCQAALDRTVAVKVLTSELDTENLARFLREQRAMGRLSGHPHIVNILEVGATESGRPYIVMQYHQDGSLDARIQRYGPIQWSEALGCGVKLAGALETAHRFGILHRDVKPANVLLTDYGEPQLTDFGIARIAGGFETSADVVLGSPAFTAPEVLEGAPPTPASDVYGLGSTLFCAVTGHAAFERLDGEPMVAQFLRIARQPIPDLRERGYPEQVCAAIEHAMARNSTDRPGSAADFGAELREAQRRNGMTVDEMALLNPRGGSPHTEQPATAVGAARPLRYSHSPPTPATRYRPPTSAHPLVERATLVDLLRASPRRLTVIHAPTGFGKSTLAAQWCDVLANEGVSVAWLTVDGDDNNVVWFLSHLIEAIRRVEPSLASELGRELEEHRDEAERYVLASLINEIHENGQRVAVVVDDWHRVTAPASVAAMTFLLDNGCHHLQIIVTTRSQSGLPLSRMRVRDELVEIDSDALRFDHNEVHSFLAGLDELELSKDDIRALLESTEGWAAALQLAALSLRGTKDPTQLIANMSGRHHSIGQFLAENVLDTLEPQMLHFLMKTSVTERINASLASALSDTSHGQAMLEKVEEQDLFLRRVDDDGVWFRYHHLFAQYLQQRLERDYPGQITELHRTAFRWFSDHGYLSEAVDHAQEAGEPQSAVNLVEREGMVLIEQAHMATLLGLVDKLSPSLVPESPRLQLTIAWANILLQRFTAARTALVLTEAALEHSSVPEIAGLRIEADVVKSVTEISMDHLEGVDELVSDCLATPDTVSPWIVSAAANVATFVATYRLDFDAAHRWQDWAGPYHRRTNGPYSVMYGNCYEGIAANEQLGIQEAEGHFRVAHQVAVASGGTQSHAARLAGSLLGELLYERGQLAEAEQLLDEGYKLGAEGGGVDFKLARYVTGARIKAVSGDRAEAVGRLREGLHAAESQSLPRLRAAIENEMTRLGERSLASSPGRDDIRFPSQHYLGDGLQEITAQLDDDTAIRELMDGHTSEDFALACAWAADWVLWLEERGRHRALMSAKRLLAGCLWAAGRADDAMSVIAPVIGQCAKLGLIRFLPDGGPQVMALVTAIEEDRLGRKAEGDPATAAFLAELLGARVPHMW